MEAEQSFSLKHRLLWAEHLNEFHIILLLMGCFFTHCKSYKWSWMLQLSFLLFKGCSPCYRYICFFRGETASPLIMKKCQEYLSRIKKKNFFQSLIFVTAWLLERKRLNLLTATSRTQLLKYYHSLSFASWCISWFSGPYVQWKW